MWDYSKTWESIAYFTPELGNSEAPWAKSLSQSILHTKFDRFVGFQTCQSHDVTHDWQAVCLSHPSKPLSYHLASAAGGASSSSWRGNEDNKKFGFFFLFNSLLWEAQERSLQFTYLLWLSVQIYSPCWLADEQKPWLAKYLSSAIQNFTLSCHTSAEVSSVCPWDMGFPPLPSIKVKRERAINLAQHKFYCFGIAIWHILHLASIAYTLNFKYVV